MQPSSLVLVAIVGMWAAYLVPSWIGRSEHRMARRRADRIAEDARVIEPRSAPEADPDAPSSAPLLRRDAALDPDLDPDLDADIDGDFALDGDPASDVDLDRGDHDDDAVTAAPDGVRLAELLGDPTRPLGEDAQVRAVAAGVLPPQRSARILRRARAELPPDEDSPEVSPARRPPRRPDRERAPQRPARPAPVDRRPAPSPSARAARRRARILTVLTAGCGLGWAAVAVLHAPAAAGVVPSGLLGADVALLVSTAPARARRRRAAATAARPSPAPARRADARGVREVSAAELRRNADAVYDVTGAVRETADGDPAAPTTADVRQPDDGTWIPVPVPPPTYTMKPVVRRPEPLVIEPIETLPAAEAGVRLGGAASQDVAVDAAVEGPVAADDAEVAFDLDAVLARRRAVNG